MPAFRFFDPYTALAAVKNDPREPAKAAKIAKADPAPPDPLAGLASLAVAAPPIADHAERIVATWDRGAEKRAAFNGTIPRDWTEGIAKLDPDYPPADAPARRWLVFISDCGQFLSGPFASKAAALGWTELDIFGCDRDRPFARIDQAGLLWLLNGDRLIALSENTATVETNTGVRQTWRCKPNQPGRTLPWELARGFHGLSRYRTGFGASGSSRASPQRNDGHARVAVSRMSDDGV
jgi:hypothetical protein